MKVALVLAMITFGASTAFAQEVSLTAKPKKCVALNKGQICYQSIRIVFESSKKIDFCITSSAQEEPLQCWANTAKVDFRHRIASSENVELRAIDSTKAIIAETEINIAWVYKQSRKRNRWRLF